ncbi:hypothetical protein LFYK43_16770 [Ligilactobacillus salitolerans]|uniref:Uncharacterized protein n=1 Tax=Ligilactobacillus salitolerans TaxID=1808352 RepID=A0A401IUP2_9LACO|nr:hypothetical protein LFYK43_16770 [Ligilactobacillus salitolerans]
MAYVIQVVVEIVALVLVLTSCAFGLKAALKTFKEQDEQDEWE